MKRKIDENNTDLIFLNISEKKSIKTKKQLKNKNEKKDCIDINTGNIRNYKLDFKQETEIQKKQVFSEQTIVKYEGKNGLDWPESSSCLCWWCCHSFEGSPIPIPISYDENKQIFKVYGNFCSFSCARAFSSKNKDFERNTYLLTYLRYKLTGNIESIKSAPPKEVLKAFGGILDIETFRNTNSIFSLVRPPFLPFNSQIQEEKIEQRINKVPKNTRMAENHSDEKIPKKLSNLGIKTIKKK